MRRFQCIFVLKNYSVVYMELFNHHYLAKHMKKIFFYCFCMLAACQVAMAQPSKPDKSKSPAKLAKEAAELEKAGDYMKAAVYYETAYTQKEENLEWVYNAGRCYLYVRDYANAAKCLADVKDQDKNPKFDKPGYKYALALKQSGQYSEAIDAFQQFIADYKGGDAEAMRKIVDTEIKGCNFGIKAKESTTDGIELEHLPAVVNTEKVEFAPIPFNDGVLYFSSTSSGTAAIYRTQKVNGNWVRPITPELFAGKMEKPNFGNGTFTPDGKRFYFTQCDLGTNGKPRCAIYAMAEEDGKWTQPFRLPDYINAENASTTHPCVVIEEDKEVLYFSSDREGGKGAFDIWYCTRTAGSAGFNFTLPKNLGNNINTLNDEITPFYHTSSNTLYFSSSGWVSAGGLDVFKSQGAQLRWEIAQNLGFPINSAGDDLYYTISESHKGGYLVSNRTFEPNKVATTNDDIFYFGQQRIEVTIKGLVQDCAEKDKTATLTDVNIKLLEMIDGGEELVENRMLAVGEYKFVLQPKKKYKVEVSRENYADAIFEINTFDFTRSETNTKNICLEIPSMNIADIRALIVPLFNNSSEVPYKLPATPPVDKKTGKPYEEGSPVYTEFKRIEANIAADSPEGKVYYDGDGGEIVAYIPKTVAVIDTPKPDPKTTKTTKTKSSSPNRNFTDDKYVDAEANISFRVQVAAVTKLRDKAYVELTKIEGLRLDYEPIEGGLTRVLLVPDGEANADGTTGFKSKAKALDALAHVLNNTRFKTAFVGKYDDGKRVGDGIRGWEEEN